MIAVALIYDLDDMQSEIESFRETLDRANPVMKASMHKGKIKLF